MPKQTLLISLIGILGLLGIAWWFSVSQANIFATGSTNKMIFFSAGSCAQCQEVDAWLKTQNFSSVGNIDRKEVNTPAVQLELQQVVTDCKLKIDQGIELPLLLAEGKCYVGPTDIKNFLAQKITGQE